MFICFEKNRKGEELFLEKLCLILLGIIFCMKVIAEKLKRGFLACQDVCRKVLFFVLFVIINNDRIIQFIKEISKI